MNQVLRVLMVEDFAPDAELVQIELEHGGYQPQLERVETAEAMQAALDTKSWDVILADFALPQFSGIAALQLLWRSGLDLPLIIVTGTLGEDAAVDAMRAGASDYVLKSNLARLVPAVERELREAANRQQRRRAEAQRDELVEQLQLQIERMPIAYLLTDAQLRFLRWNPAAERIFGFSEAEVVGRHPFEMIVPPQSQAVVGDLFLRLQQGDMTAGGVCENITRDGRTILCEWLNTPLKGPDGAFRGLLSLAQDITERRRAEEARRLSELRKLAIVEASLDAIVTIDHEARVVEVNGAAERMFGFERQKVLGQSMLERIVPAPQRQACWDGIQDYLRSGQSRVLGKRVEMTALRNDGSEFPVEVAVTRITTDGEPVFTAHIRDLTERKQLEEQYRHAQKMEAVGQLAAGVAHDFNNLLTVIISYGELLLRQTQPGDPSRDLIAEITRAGDRAAALTRQLLTFSRQQVLAPKVLDLNYIVGDVQSLLRRVIGEDIELCTKLQPTVGPIKADPGQLEQVLVNLAVNARDAMPQGGKLVVETHNTFVEDNRHPDAVPGPHVRLTVSDTGHGMPPEIRARIFEPFFTTKEKGRGSGLGLATVYGIVKQSGGHIQVDSVPKLGTSFHLYFPRIEAPLVTLEKPVAVLSAAPRGNETVLLVEDDDGVRVLARVTLESSGYRVLEASLADEGLAIAADWHEPLHLLVTDVVMPGLGGRELAERLTLLQKGIKVLYISGYTDDAVVRHGVLQETVHFLQKPFTPDLLARKVREVLDHSV